MALRAIRAAERFVLKISNKTNYNNNKIKNKKIKIKNKK